MPKQPRVLYKDAIYHVFSRGNSKRVIFKESEDFCMFLKICSNTYTRYPFNVFCYCLMSNHYHFLIQTQDANLPDIMRLINQKYAIYFNRKYNDVGYLFQGRYKAKLVEDDQYFSRLFCYILRNPVEAKLVNTLEEWTWSSYKYIQDHDQLKPQFLKLNLLEEKLGVSPYTKLEELYGFDLSTSIEKMKSQSFDRKELNDQLVKLCQSFGVTSSKDIANQLDLNERSVRRIKVRLGSRT